MTATAPRTLTVITPIDTPYVSVTEGTRQDTYRLSVGYKCVRWVHTADADRGGIVTLNGAGRAVSCDCRGWRYEGKCRHAAGTETMVRRGLLDVPVVADTRAGLGDQPEGWLYTSEGE